MCLCVYVCVLYVYDGIICVMAMEEVVVSCIN